jgi:hypothetical protein
MRRDSTLRRTSSRVDRLCRRFSEYVAAFDRAQLFTGPSLYFHFRTLERLQQHDRASSALQDDLFFEYLYATLSAWGLHRMGPGAAKLVDFPRLTQSIRNQQATIAKLERHKITELREDNVGYVTDLLWQVLGSIHVSESQTRLVANSKALHHILPQLMPPIDREYTLRFFYGNKTISGRDEQIFRELYPLFWRVASLSRSQILSSIGRDFHTSETKVIDNAIVGFVMSELKAPR